ncbi:uncharacterized protein LOC131649097 [Vicia villosa]|uniref:uncharacterized protein LOC131649097 n=1 Tax=Vicia villosa TaxID=3911 RepID=UPI00273BF5C9|nr:uncharacterized protein LOC131649097 [Vicia villosa]
MAADPPSPEILLGDYGRNNIPSGRLTIVNQPVNVAQFQLHPSTINQLERRSFAGRVNEDANKHLERFLTMSSMLKIEGHTEETKRLRMFPFTLAHEAEEWFYSLPTGSITTWAEMEKAFLQEYFPASVSLRKRYEILNFKQKEGDSLGDAYKRFKIILLACPTHNMDDTKQMQMFVNGLKIQARHILDSAAGGSSNFATTTGMKKIIEAIASNEHLELYDRVSSKPAGIINLKLETNKQVKIEETVATEVEKRLKALNIGAQKVAQVQQASNEVCEICSGPHNTVHCFATPQQIEDIKFLKQNNPYSNTYNPWWKNHPNFAWRDQKGNPTTFNSKNNQKNTTASIKTLEVQLGQIAQHLASSSQAHGTLPSGTVQNPRDQNHVKAVVTRKSKATEKPEEEKVEDDGVLEVDLEIRDNSKQSEEVIAPPKADRKETGT